MIFKRLMKIPLCRLIGPAVVVAAIYWAGPAKVWAVLSRADLKFVVAVIALAIPLAIIKGIRWRILLHNYDIGLTFRDSTSMYAMGMVLSAVTPGRVGDLVKIVLLIKKGFSAAKAIASNILDRLFDMVFVFLAGYGGMWYFSKSFASQLNIVNIIFLIVLVLGVVVAIKRHLIKELALKLVPTQYHSAAIDSWNEIVNSLLRNRTRWILWLPLWTIVFWAVQFFALYLCAKALRIDVSFIYFSACAAVGMVLSLLPITVAGVGTRDATYILLLGQIGIAQQQSLALSTLVLAVFLANCVVFYAVSVIAKLN
jgi:uncharacterized protein (TIRG00374 family)